MLEKKRNLIFRPILLFPFAVLYGIITGLRNLLFNWKILPQKKHVIPIICVGNISMGGTGKTPMVEYLIQEFAAKYKTGILSRGYGRKTKGYILADQESGAIKIGDESRQYAKKFPATAVAVSENRNKGVENLLKDIPELDLIILDDAFQHRWIKAGFNILLTDYYRLYSDDYIVPAGNLRESRRGARRADLIIVTKTPVVLSPITRRRIANELKIKKHQQLLFSKISYDGLKPYFENQKARIKKRYTHIVLFTGIANNYPLQDYLKQMCSDITVLSFPDHHIYNQKDISRILKVYNEVFSKNKILVTTEKDMMRLSDCKRIYLFEEIPFYYAPIRVQFQNGDGKVLSEALASYMSRAVQ